MRIICALAFALSVSPALAQQSRSFYGPSGQYEGHATQDGNSTSYYGPSGQYLGHTTDNAYSNSRSFYGPAGQYQGHETYR
jgi:hypothetical protein